MDDGPRGVGSEGPAVTEVPVAKIYLAVVAEASRDAIVVRQLVERIGVRIEAKLIGPTPGVPNFIKWADLPRLLLEHRVKPWHGHFGGKPGQPDSAAGANALRLLRHWTSQGRELDAIVLQRDADKQPQRREGLQQARAEVPLNVKVIIGVAHPKLEAWAICAFDPYDVDGHDRLRAARKELGFDPRERSHELDASEPRAKRNAKRVLEQLVGPASEAFDALCATASLDTLRTRGRGNGLADFLSDVEALLLDLPAGAEDPV